LEIVPVSETHALITDERLIDERDFYDSGPCGTWCLLEGDGKSLKKGTDTVGEPISVF
jgi:hypothetical protein